MLKWRRECLPVSTHRRVRSGSLTPVQPGTSFSRYVHRIVGFSCFPAVRWALFFCITQYSRAHCDELQKIFQILLAEDRAHGTVMLGHQVPKARGDRERQPTMNERNTLTPDRWEMQGRNGPGCLPCQSLGGLPFPRQLTNPSPEGYSVLAGSKPIGRWHTAKGNT